MKKKSVKKIKYPIHKMGKTYGYEEFEDGSIEIAPCLADKIDKIMIREAAVAQLLKSITQQCNELLIPIEKERVEFWDELKAEYGLDLAGAVFTYDRRDRKVTHQVRKDETSDIKSATS